PTDRAFTALHDDNAARGMLDDTLVLSLGEFGRSPRVNNMAGREHWAAAQSIALAGAGVRAGTVFGATDRDGAYPIADAVSPADVAATVLALMGVPDDLTLTDRAGRTVPACTGRPIAGVLA
ncbi:MAG: DUF1501 domain-containing protein, partial [Thermoleophilia bacterium]|nr:DUF1501 domain-containing protein [Thermoleophilia bacterium]